MGDFFSGFSASTRTRVAPGSRLHRREDPASTPRKAATASGIVVRTESLCATALETFEVKVAGNVTPGMVRAAHRLGFALHVGQRLMRSARPVWQQVGQMDAEENPAPWTDQRTPALAIVARGDQIRVVSATHLKVKSQSQPDRTYSVRLTADGWLCECAHYAQAGRDCIHILAAKFRRNIREALEPVAERPSCSCGSEDVKREGFRHNKSGSVARWSCKACGRKFTGRDGFHKRRADPEKIALALDLYFRGLSLRKVSEHIHQVHGLKLSPMTVYRWVTHYGRLAAEWMDSQGARTSDRWHMDETVVNVDGQQRYLWNVMDAETRFLLATHISRTRDIQNTRAPLKKAKNATPDRPSEVFTDGMNAYPYAVKREIGVGVHQRVPSIRAKESNNRIERLHGTEKERTKVMRGFDGEEGAAGIAEGFRAHYNLVRKHQTLGVTPGEAAGLEPLEGFKWRAVIERAVQKATAAAKEASPREVTAEEET